MRITKEFTFEGSHVVRNCTSHRCSHSVHGHSYRVLVTLEGSKLDHAGMLVDFGLLKGTVKEFIDSLDHCHVICSFDSEEYVDFFRQHNDRWVCLPFNPSAEMLSIFIHRFVQMIIDNTIFANGETSDLKVYSVKVYETATGSAESSIEDVKNIWNELWLMSIGFSEGVVNDWSKNTKEVILKNGKVKNPTIKQQIKVPHFNCD